MNEQLTIGYDIIIKNDEGHMILDVTRARLLLGIRKTGSLRGAVKYVGVSRPHTQKWVKVLNASFNKPVYSMDGVNGKTRIELTDFGDWLLDTYINTYSTITESAANSTDEIKSHFKGKKDVT